MSKEDLKKKQGVSKEKKRDLNSLTTPSNLFHRPLLISRISKGGYKRCPPLAPSAAMDATRVFLSRLSSKEEKRKLSIEYTDIFTENVLKRYAGDEHALRYIMEVYSLILAQVNDLSDFRKKIKKRFEEADLQWDKKKKDLAEQRSTLYKGIVDRNELALKNVKELRNAEMKDIKAIESPLSAKGLISRILTIGGISAAFQTAQQELIKFLQSISDKLKGFVHSTYLGALLSIGLAVYITIRIFNSYVKRKREKIINEYNDEEGSIKEEYAEEKKNLIETVQKAERDAFDEYAKKKKAIEDEELECKQKRAAFVYVEVFKLCETYYPDYIDNYKEYKKLKTSENPEKAIEYIHNHALKLARAELVPEPMREILPDQKTRKERKGKSIEEPTKQIVH